MAGAAAGADGGGPPPPPNEPPPKRARAEPPPSAAAAAARPPGTAPVLAKLAAALECVHRPLREGEKPKRPGQDTVFEATGRLSPEVDVGLLRDARVTVKHDGTCCLVGADGALFRRRDIRRKDGPPAGAVRPDGTPAQAGDDICWIVVPATGRATGEDQFHRSALAEAGAAHSLDAAGAPTVGPLRGGMTYELVGPKVQGNPYGCPAGATVQLRVGKKDRHVPRHYLIEHGAFEIAGWDTACFLADPLGYARRFILDHEIEGVVFHCPGGVLYKINRGHIGATETRDGAGVGRLRVAAPRARAAASGDSPDYVPTMRW